MEWMGLLTENTLKLFCKDNQEVLEKLTETMIFEELSFLILSVKLGGKCE